MSTTIIRSATIDLDKLRQAWTDPDSRVEDLALAVRLPRGLRVEDAEGVITPQAEAWDALVDAALVDALPDVAEVMRKAIERRLPWRSPA